MINLISFISVLIVNFIMQQSEAYPEMVNSFVSIALMFCVFANFFIMILKDKVPSAKVRYSFMCVLYIVLMLDCIFATFYFSYYLMDFKPFKLFCQIFIYSTFFAAMILTKKYEFRQGRNYGFERQQRRNHSNTGYYSNAYQKFMIAETAVLTLLAILDIAETTQTMILYPWSIILIIALFGLLAMLSLLRQWFEPYWLHKKILFVRLLKLAEDHIIDKAVIPPQREIESDLILREVKYVLERSFIRPLEVNRLTKQLHDMMIAEGYDKNVAVNYCAMWSQTMIANLMKRKNDFSYMPNFMLKIASKLGRYNGNRRKYL